MSRIPLPIDPHLPQILETLRQHPALVLVASPGAGKTTRVPAALLRSGILPSHADGILLLEPRRLAARAAAARIASEQGWDLGAEVGYQVRFENRTSRATKLTVITEGLLNKRLARDPQLEGIGCVILDEFHERSWHSDLGLGLLKELQELARPDLKIIVMSATLQAESVAQFLSGAPVMDVKVEAHPVAIHHDREPQSFTTGPEFLDRVTHRLSDVLQGRAPGNGHVLVFLPGTREIHGVLGRIESEARRLDVDVLPLHGSLRLEDQDRAIRPSDRRKVILATNIAETSLTIDGVATVIDSGLARVLRQDAAGFPHLELSRISRFSAIQRTGRAGRQGPGVCHRLWGKLDEAAMPVAETPEILRTDLAEACLLLAAQGVSDFDSFSWFERPPQAALEAARILLEKLEALTPQTQDPRSYESRQRSATKTSLVHLTDLGRRLLSWPLHPRLARMMEEVLAVPERIPTAARIAALVSERDILSDPGALKHATSLESDVLLRLDVLEGRLGGNTRGERTGERRSERDSVVDFGAVTQVKRAAEQIGRIAREARERACSAPGRSHLLPSRLDADASELQLLLIGFPDRVCRRRRPGEPEARMVGGKGVRLARTSCVERAEFFIAVDAIGLSGGPRGGTERSVTIASRIDPVWLKRFFPHQVREERRAALDGTSGRILKQIFSIYDDLPLEEPRLAPADAEDIARLLPDLVADRWLQILERNEPAARWLDRYRFLQTTCPEKTWPAFDFRDPTHAEVRSLIEAASFGETAPHALVEKDLLYHFENAIGPELTAFLKTQAPDAIEVPSGSRLRIHYPEGRAPYLEVRIQEIFGWTRSPQLAEGRVRLSLHLLGPNFRPVQVTSDLESFWANGYVDVRKELRARYPKHSWPEDPLTARPEAKGSRRSPRD